MKITDCQWTDAQKRVVQCVIDGKVSSVPVDERNKEWRAIVLQGLPIAEPDE